MKLLRSAAIKLIIGAILLAAISSLRSLSPLSTPQSNSTDETPTNCNLAVRHAAPVVVNVYNRGLNTDSHNQLKIHALGPSVVIDQRGYIITSKHVINDAGQIIVALRDGCVFEALLVRPDSLTDLAILEINTTDGSPTIPTDARRIPHIGDVVLAIGNPYNLGQTIIQGIISATGRAGLNPTGWRDSLQTGASINHGNSGDALVNSLGELMGINALSFGKNNDGETPEDIDFTIPSQLTTKITDELARSGRVIHGHIDTGGREIAPLHVQGGSIGQLQRIVVNEMSPDGPATNAGIQANDLIISVGNKPVIPVLGTMDQVAEIRPGSAIPIIMMRDDKQLALQVTIQRYSVAN